LRKVGQVDCHKLLVAFPRALGLVPGSHYPMTGMLSVSMALTHVHALPEKRVAAPHDGAQQNSSSGPHYHSRYDTWQWIHPLPPHCHGLYYSSQPSLRQAYRSSTEKYQYDEPHGLTCNHRLLFPMSLATINHNNYSLATNTNRPVYEECPP